MAKATKSRFYMYLDDNLRAHVERRLISSDRSLAAELRYLIRHGLAALGDPLPDQAAEYEAQDHG